MTGSLSHTAVPFGNRLVHKECDPHVMEFCFLSYLPKGKRSYLVLGKTLYYQKMKKSSDTQDATINSDYTTIAERLRAVSWNLLLRSNWCGLTG